MRSTGETKTMFSLPEGGGMPGTKTKILPEACRSIVQSTLGNESLGRKDLKENQCSPCHQAAEGKTRLKKNILREALSFICIVLSALGNESLDRREHAKLGLPQGSGRPGKTTIRISRAKRGNKTCCSNVLSALGNESLDWRDFQIPHSQKSRPPPTN